ncbi:hypothetical protein CUJ89_08580 [Burkholderia pyrrocinia]|uniref:DUF2622 domain-containing protein n=1 Tax=Burkholderia pyrrocinia TaxID=60550 RepID=A0A2Z5MTA3_BURPY|nr:hypothetical protein CUJ89_08580 [Burkholderia pyrrocinia]
MTNFVTRVELHSATSDDYEALHTHMAAKGFKRTIVGGDGVTYNLPSATYSYVGNATTETVRDAARAAANSTGKSSWIVSTEGLSSWYLPNA